VKQSAQVLEWQAEARQEGRREGRQEGEQRGLLRGKQEDITRLLQRRFNKRIPKTLVTRIIGTTDLATLEQWFDAAVTIGSLKEFQQLVDS
jgi:predicted transposase YdaD